MKTAPGHGRHSQLRSESVGLLPVQFALWQQWVLVRLDAVGPSVTEIPDLDFSRFHWFERRHYMLDCNWKVFVDNYLDGGYHVPHLHKALDRVLDYRNIKSNCGERHCFNGARWPAAGERCTTGLIPTS